MTYNCDQAQERTERSYSALHEVWYDVYPCPIHGVHIDVDWKKEW